ncbi:unnamed protein product, partial [Callosobruchus maculatus]
YEHIYVWYVRTPNLVQIGRIVLEIVHVNNLLFTFDFGARAPTAFVVG